MSDTLDKTKRLHIAIIRLFIKDPDDLMVMELKDW